MPKVIGGSLEQHRQHTRELIFEALSTLMYEKGYDAVTLADVAAQAGIARTAIYNYFPDKDALIVGFAGHETERYVDSLRQALDQVDNPVDRLRTYIRLQLQYFAAQHLPPGAALRVVLPEAAYQRVADHVAVLEHILRDILEDGVTEGYLPPVDVDATLPLVGVCISRVGSVEPGGDAFEEGVATTTTFVLRALGIHEGPDGRPQRLTDPSPPDVDGGTEPPSAGPGDGAA